MCYNRALGGVAEWSNAPVLKTGVSQGTVSSNLTPSAMKYTGIVQHGERRGSALGYPTANIALDDKELSGVYVARVTIKDEAPYQAAAFADSARGILEAHILDFSDDIYDMEIAVELLGKLRESSAYESDEKLKAAIANDITKVREFFKN